MKKYLELQDINAYVLACDLANYVWDVVRTWNYFERDTVGKQLVRAVDSVPANIAEGFGRYFKKEKIRFYRISLGSLKETEDWIAKAHKRRLLQDLDHERMCNKLCRLPRELNAVINFTDARLAI
ncbi:MAG: four helix bundle protein [Candidatus Omnitrophica bacterium]|nr:four helix bundle protein [Candidatus Omnitrophota bacterium]